MLSQLFLIFDIQQQIFPFFLVKWFPCRLGTASYCTVCMRQMLYSPRAWPTCTSCAFSA